MIRQPGRLVISSMVVGLTTLALMLATQPRMAIVWDEGYTLGREARIREWFRALRDPGRFAVEWQPPASAEDLVMEDGTSPPRREQLDLYTKLLLDRRVV